MEIPDGFTPTKGRKPRTGERKLEVIFRNGFRDRKHSYTSAQLRWTDSGDDWDVIAVRRAN